MATYNADFGNRLAGENVFNGITAIQVLSKYIGENFPVVITKKYDDYGYFLEVTKSGKPVYWVVCEEFSPATAEVIVQSWIKGFRPFADEPAVWEA